MQEMLIQIQIFVYLNRKSSQSISTKHLQTNVIYFETLILEYRTEIPSEGVQTGESEISVPASWCRMENKVYSAWTWQVS